MANDCLVTKLKGVVDNDNLEKLGELVITLKAGSVLANLQLRPPVGVTVTCDNTVDGVKVIQGANSYDMPYTVQDLLGYTGISIAGDNVPVTLTRDTTIRINDSLYENVRFLSLNDTISTINSNYFRKLKYVKEVLILGISSLCTIDGIEEIFDVSEINWGVNLSMGLNLFNNGQGQLLKGNVSAFEGCVGCTNFRMLKQTGITGNISSFEHFTLTNEILVMNAPALQGSMENLIEALKANGAAENKIIYMNFGGSAVTFHNETVAAGDAPYGVKFTQNGAEVWDRHYSTKYATYVVGSGWTYEE